MQDELFERLVRFPACQSEGVVRNNSHHGIPNDEEKLDVSVHRLDSSRCLRGDEVTRGLLYGDLDGKIEEKELFRCTSNGTTAAKKWYPQRCLLVHFEATLDFSHSEFTCS